ncbi:Fur family transcriptional regulator [Mycetocola reblochoni]|uniref:Transcriptional regulator, FUR family n=1 Tax=Mycetocola reblochoni REB411 TaxID=1255698 RepID=A0A1R4IXZ8_9MICO|nr:Fur family transcriptional regulator [Mycetocola reblochoni]SJN24193.1 Transcriptional regulator, FUR family [Mycetocola reblochoni REB411]
MTDGYEQLIRGAGLRVTAGRVAVLRTLDTRPHSDADAIHRIVAGELENTSIQSVHNILGDLAGTGLIRRIVPAGSSARYERRVDDNHHHLVCTECGAVSDVDCVVGAAPCLTPADTGGFAVATAEVTFWGLCPRCQAA